MSESILSVLPRRRWPGARFVVRVVRRTIVESLYLLTAPVTAMAGLLLALVGLGLGTVGWLLPGRSRVMRGALAPARWSGDLEGWAGGPGWAPAGRRGGRGE